MLDSRPVNLSMQNSSKQNAGWRVGCFNSTGDVSIISSISRVPYLVVWFDGLDKFEANCLRPFGFKRNCG